MEPPINHAIKPNPLMMDYLTVPRPSAEYLNERRPPVTTFGRNINLAPGQQFLYGQSNTTPLRSHPDDVRERRERLIVANPSVGRSPENNPNRWLNLPTTATSRRTLQTMLDVPGQPHSVFSLLTLCKLMLIAFYNIQLKLGVVDNRAVRCNNRIINDIIQVLQSHAQNSYNFFVWLIDFIMLLLGFLVSFTVTAGALLFKCMVYIKDIIVYLCGFLCVYIEQPMPDYQPSGRYEY